jgi:ABC-type multidrug transport system fused ATPase/permease subunit
MLLLAFEGGAVGVVEKLSEPALGVVAQTTLGAITVVMLAVAITAVYKLSSVQDARAKDAKEAAEKAEALVTKMVESMGASQRTLDAFVHAERQAEQMSREQTVLLQQLKQAFDTTIRDMLMRSTRSATPPPGRS